MTKSFPYLALDSAGERTILCDYPVPMFDNTTKKETTKVKTLSNDQLSHYVGMAIKNQSAADRYWARCLGRDSAMDDETVERLKGFLKNKLTAEDHEQVCNMLAGDVEAQDYIEPPSGDPEEKPTGRLASDAKSFAEMFPGAARIRVDSSGTQPRARGANYSSDGAKSFAEMFPDAARIKVL
jgi:hypothetical protein